MGTGPGDVAASLELCECAAKVAIGNRWCMEGADYDTLQDLSMEMRAWHLGVLRRGGCLVMKILEGAFLPLNHSIHSSIISLAFTDCNPWL
jgi:hypothetical protein